MHKTILIGNNGKASMLGLFPLLADLDCQLVARHTYRKSGKLPYFRIYENGNTESYTKGSNKMGIRNAIVVRWGTQLQIPLQDCIVYNETKALALASDKKRSREVMSEAGVRVPKIITKDTLSADDYPVIGRPPKHCKGQNFHAFEDEASVRKAIETNPSWYFSAYVKKTIEYRVHCAHGKVLSVMRKPIPEDPAQLAWNLDFTDESFEALKWSEVPHDVCLQSLLAMEALGLDFGGVDVVVKDNLAYVLEVNTSPALDRSPYNTGRYARYFQWLFRKDEKREHFEFKEFKKPSSFVWKNFQLDDRAASADAEEPKNEQ